MMSRNQKDPSRPVIGRVGSSEGQGPRAAGGRPAKGPATVMVLRGPRERRRMIGAPRQIRAWISRAVNGLNEVNLDRQTIPTEISLA